MKTKVVLRISFLLIIVSLVCVLFGCSMVQSTLKVPENIVVEKDTVIWNSVDGATKYLVYVNGREHSTNGAATEFDLSKLDLVDGQTYTVKVKAVGDGYLKLSSEYSEEISFRYEKGDTVVDTNPTKLDVPTNISIEENVVRWSSVGGASRYRLYVDGREHSTKGSETFFDLSTLNLLDGQTYYVKIQAVSDNSTKLDSDYSNDRSFTYIEKDDSGNGDIDDGGTSDKYLDETVVESIVNSMDSTSTYYGVGRQVNVITDEYANFTAESVGQPRIFDTNKLMALNWYKQPVGDMKAESYTASSMSDLYVQANVGFKNSFNAKASLGNVFSAGFENSFGFSAGVGYKNTANEIYYTSSQYYGATLVAIDGYYDISQFSNILSTSFINNIIALENGETTAENIINTYGTHAVLAAYFGGKITCNSHIRNTSTKWTAEMALEYESKISTALSSLLSAGNSTSVSLSAQLEIANGTSEEHFTATAIGGDGFPALSLQDYLANYSAWVSSMNNITVEKSVIIKLPKNSLVAIWDLLPSQYSKAKTLLQNYFDYEVEHCNSEFLSQFERHYNEPIPDVDYGNTTDYAGGHGSLESPYLISNVVHLQNINKDLDAHYKLLENITLTTEWIPIGYINSQYSAFTGTFDGNNKTINGLKKLSFPQYIENEARFGLFNSLDGATISDLRLENINISFSSVDGNTKKFAKIGGIAGTMINSTIIRCSVKGNMQTGDNYEHQRYMFVGGISGEAIGSNLIQYCKSATNIKATHRVCFVGGIIGRVGSSDKTKNTRILYSYNTGNLDVWSAYAVGTYTGAAGGIIGHIGDIDADSTKYDSTTVVEISSCYSCGDIRVARSAYVGLGGIIGRVPDVSTIKQEVKADIYDNYYCSRLENNKDDNYDLTSYATYSDNLKEKGNYKTHSEMTAGNEIGCLYTYSSTSFASNPAYCWVYQAGELPKLYWE